MNLTRELLTITAEFGSATRHAEQLADDLAAVALSIESAEAEMRRWVDDHARLGRLHDAAVARLNEARDQLVAATRALDPEVEVGRYNADTGLYYAG